MDSRLGLVRYDLRTVVLSSLGWLHPDGEWNLARGGQSIVIDRMGWSFVLLFLLSIPLWWFFEGMNAIVRNWHYHLARPITSLHYFVQASVDFSIVIPAVLSTTFLLTTVFEGRSVTWLRWRPKVTVPALVSSVLVGVGCFALLPLLPNETFPLVWIAPILILEPIAYAVGFPSLLKDIERNGWSRTCAIMMATIITGFWWEMWNYYSLPKWSYTIPYGGFWKIFEMPFLGYFGYPFFGLVVFSYASLALMLLTRRDLFEIVPDTVSTRALEQSSSSN
jgi:hypothetical protein